MIFSTDADKTSNKTQNPLMMKILSKLEFEGELLNLLKGLFFKKQPTSNNDEMLRNFLLKLGRRRWVHYHNFYSTLHWRS